MNKMKKKKCYISGKITGLSKSNYEAKFNQAKKEIKQMGFIPISPLELPHNHDHSWEEYIFEGIIEMLKCNCVYFLKNWKNSKGAILERCFAYYNEMDLLYQKNKK